MLEGLGLRSSKDLLRVERLEEDGGGEEKRWGLEKLVFENIKGAN